MQEGQTNDDMNIVKYDDDALAATIDVEILKALEQVLLPVTASNDLESCQQKLQEEEAQVQRAKEQYDE